jgi:glutamyl-tRNA reductase
VFVCVCLSLIRVVYTCYMPARLQERETVARLTKRIVAKLLHGPISHLRTMDSVGDFETSIKSFEKIFKM